MAGYNLTPRQKEIIRAIVHKYREAALHGDFVFVAAYGQAERIGLPKINVSIEAGHSDLVTLAEQDLISFRKDSPLGAWLGAPKQKAFDAVDADFAVAAPASSSSFTIHGPVGALQTGNNSAAHVNQQVGDATALLNRLAEIQTKVSELDYRDRDIGAILQEIILTIRLMQEKPEEGKPKLAALFDRAKPWVELATAIIALKTTG